MPAKRDSRVPVLLIFGNPASHSITSGMFFSPKENGAVNRFWEHLLGWAGIRKLLGKRAFDQVAEEESHRVLKEAANYLQPNGFGVVFQKDAWNGLSSNGNYSLEMAKTGELKSTF